MLFAQCGDRSFRTRGSSLRLFPLAFECRYLGKHARAVVDDRGPAVEPGCKTLEESLLHVHDNPSYPKVSPSRCTRSKLNLAHNRGLVYLALRGPDAASPFGVPCLCCDGSVWRSWSLGTAARHPAGRPAFNQLPPSTLHGRFTPPSRWLAACCGCSSRHGASGARRRAAWLECNDEVSSRSALGEHGQPTPASQFAATGNCVGRDVRA